jgi:hypothetical protein
VPLRYDGQTLTVCTNRPGQAGSLAAVEPTDSCRNFRAKRPKPVRTVPPDPPDDSVRYIALTKGRYAIVDAADYEVLNRYRWCVSGKGSRAYAVRCHKGTHISMHRFLMKPPKGMVVDHINGNGLDNRRSNLRICTQQQNLYNSRPKGKSSRFKGPCWDKSRQKWIVIIRYEGRNMQIGRFDDEVEAARAYDRKAYELFGEYAWLNFPEEFGLEPRHAHERGT